MYEFAVGMLQPYRLLVLLLGLAILNLWRQRRESRRGLVFLTTVYLALLAISTPAVAHLALGSLEWQYAPLERRPSEARAIVVLSAGLRVVSEDETRVEMDEDTQARCQYAVELYRQGQACPVVVSGGKVDPDKPGPAVAQVMAAYLRELGVKASDLIVEDRSRTTFENAVESAKVLAQRKLDNVLLVADAVDMFRAVRCFEKQGVSVLAAPCHKRALAFRPTVFSFLPSSTAVLHCQRVVHEWLGVAWYWVHGRI